MARTIRQFLLVEAAAFGAAALVHRGVLMRGYEHREAAIAESVLAAVLLAGLIASVAFPRWTRAAGLTAQGAALFGTMVGVFTMVIGVGPRTTFDVVLHTGFIIVLVAGLVLGLGARIPGPPAQA